MKLTATEASDFEAAPEGLWPARVIWVVDLGLQDGPYGVKPQVFINFEVLADGTHYTLGKFYTASLNEKSVLNKDLSSMRGRKIKPGEEIDLGKVLGAFCQLQVMENDKGRRVVAAVLPKGQQFESLEKPLTEADYEELPEYFQEKIAGQLVETANPTAQPKRQPGGISGQLDDEVPF